MSHDTVSVNSIGYDSINNKLILKTGGADTVVPFSSGLDITQLKQTLLGDSDVLIVGGIDSSSSGTNYGKFNGMLVKWVNNNLNFNKILDSGSTTFCDDYPLFQLSKSSSNNTYIIGIYTDCKIKGSISGGGTNVYSYNTSGIDSDGYYTFNASSGYKYLASASYSGKAGFYAYKAISGTMWSMSNGLSLCLYFKYI